jgi:hypothetical protein
VKIKTLFFVAIATPTVVYAWLKGKSRRALLRSQPFYDQVIAKGVPLEAADLVAELLTLIENRRYPDYQFGEKPLSVVVKKGKNVSTFSLRTKQGRDLFQQACERKAAAKLLQVLEGDTDWFSREGFIQEIQPEVTYLKYLKDIRLALKEEAPQEGLDKDA